MLEAYKDYWTRYTDFSGKTGREGYWYVFLMHFLVSLAVRMVLPENLHPLWNVANLIPMLAIGFRRIRSAGRNPLHYLWILTGIGVFWVLYLLVQPDQK